MRAIMTARWFLPVVVVLVAVLAMLGQALASTIFKRRALRKEQRYSVWNPRVDSLEERKNRRASLMYELYRITNGNPALRIKLKRLQLRLDWSSWVIIDVCDFLTEAGLAKIDYKSDYKGAPAGVSWHYLRNCHISLTASGVLEVEAALLAPDEPTEHLPPINNVIIQGDVQGDVYVSIVSVLDQRHVQVINRYLQDYREVLEDLPPEPRDIALADLTTAEAQLKSPKPNRGALREALRSLRSIAEGMAGNAAFMGIIELGRRLHL